MKADHPAQEGAVLPDHTKIAIADILVKGVKGFKDKTLRAMRKWLGKASEREQNEKRLHETIL